jgi:hypothetical protein
MTSSEAETNPDESHRLPAIAIEQVHGQICLNARPPNATKKAAPPPMHANAGPPIAPRENAYVRTAISSESTATLVHSTRRNSRRSPSVRGRATPPAPTPPTPLAPPRGRKNQVSSPTAKSRTPNTCSVTACIELGATANWKTRPANTGATMQPAPSTTRSHASELTSPMLSGLGGEMAVSGGRESLSGLEVMAVTLISR